MTLFITGSESFIGKNLIRICQSEGLAVTGIDSVAPSQAGFLEADICDLSIGDTIPEGATIIHLAAVSRDPDCRANPHRAFEVNVGGTLNLAAAARRRNAKQFVFASSEWVYGEVGNDQVQTEGQPIDITKMKSEYAISKLTAEQLLRLAAGFDATTILRFGIVYGPRAQNWSAVEALCNSTLQGTTVKVGSVKTARRFIHVDDICSGILAALGRFGLETFNLSGDHLISLGDVVNTASDILGKTVDIVQSDPAASSIRNPDNSQARAHLGWRPRLDLRQGVSTVLDFLTRK